MVVVCLLGGLGYETHNAPGRYVLLENRIYLDTSTGKHWKYNTNAKEWTLLVPAIPNRSHSVD